MFTRRIPALFLHQQQKMSSSSSAAAQLAHRIDKFNGIIVDSSQLPSAESFDASLKDSLSEWKRIGRRSIWLKIPIQKSELIPIAVKHGLLFHHAQPDYCMLRQWLSEGEPDKMPGYATHFVGVAGYVEDGNGNVLVIREMHEKKPNMFKVPGGLADPGEDIFAAAQREVLEETGVQCEPVSILCFREKHDYLFGKSDLYFVCRMRATSTAITAGDGEVSEAKWMPREEFASLSETYPTQRAISKIGLYGAMHPEAEAEFKYELVDPPYFSRPDSPKMKLFRSSKTVELELSNKQ